MIFKEANFLIKGKKKKKKHVQKSEKVEKKKNYCLGANLNETEPFHLNSVTGA